MAAEQGMIEPFPKGQVRDGVPVISYGVSSYGYDLRVSYEFKMFIDVFNTTPLPAKFFANEGLSQVLFFGVSEICETSYAVRGSKCQKQEGFTTPLM